MRPLLFVKLLLGLLAGVLVSTPVALACSGRGDCGFGPSLGCQQLLYDPYFVENCPYWVPAGYAWWVEQGGDAFYEIASWGGSVHQYVTVDPSVFQMEMSAEIKLVKNAPGTERLNIDIIPQYGSTERVATVYPSSNGLNKSFALNNYAGQKIRLRFSVAPGGNPGDTFFHVTTAHMFSYG